MKFLLAIVLVCVLFAFGVQCVTWYLQSLEALNLWFVGLPTFFEVLLITFYMVFGAVCAIVYILFLIGIVFSVEGW